MDASVAIFITGLAILDLRSIPFRYSTGTLVVLCYLQIGIAAPSSGFQIPDGVLKLLPDTIVCLLSTVQVTKRYIYI